MYYEMEGEGRPLLLLHGGLATINSSFGDLLPALSRTARVITPDMQGHGHTPDRVGPLSLEKMVDDMDTLLTNLGLDRIDVVGYSLGGIVAMGLAIRYPERVLSVSVIGTPFSTEDLDPQVREAIRHSGIDGVPVPFRDAYVLDAPSPKHLEEFVAKVHHLLLSFRWSDKQLRHITAPCLMIYGDHDIVPAERAVFNFRMRSITSQINRSRCDGRANCFPNRIFSKAATPVREHQSCDDFLQVESFTSCSAHQPSRKSHRSTEACEGINDLTRPVA